MLTYFLTYCCWWWWWWWWLVITDNSWWLMMWILCDVVEQAGVKKTADTSEPPAKRFKWVKFVIRFVLYYQSGHLHLLSQMHFPHRGSNLLVTWCHWLFCRQLDARITLVTHTSTQRPYGWCGARGRCRISPPRFLAECRKRRLSQGSFVSAACLFLYFLWFVSCSCVYFCDLYCIFLIVCLSVTVTTGCEDCLRNDLYSVGRGLNSAQSNPIQY